jgi:activator of 2-hydroxyglutaryl-CoA dehydratase
MGVEPEVAMVGGGARDIGLVRALQEMRNQELLVPPEPQLTAAFGAALIGMESLKPSDPTSKGNHV